MTPAEAKRNIEECLREATGLRIRAAGKDFWVLLIERITELQNPPLAHAALGYVLALSAKVLIDAGMNVADLIKLEEFGATLAQENIEWGDDDHRN